MYGGGGRKSKGNLRKRYRRTSVDFPKARVYTKIMQNAEGPGQIPEWKEKLSLMTPHARTLLAVALGVTERTVFNWAKGVSEPTEAMVIRISSQLKKVKK